MHTLIDIIFWILEHTVLYLIKAIVIILDWIFMIFKMLGNLCWWPLSKLYEWAMKD